MKANYFDIQISANPFIIFRYDVHPGNMTGKRGNRQGTAGLFEFDAL